MPKAGTVYIAAAMINRSDGKTLLVRKQGTSAFMQAGGKLEANEEPMSALRRELAEELGLSIDHQQPEYLGQYEAPAANEPGWIVNAKIYVLEVTKKVVPSAEIEEIKWVDPRSVEDIDLAPLTRNHVMPLCRQRL